MRAAACTQCERRPGRPRNSLSHNADYTHEFTNNASLEIDEVYGSVITPNRKIKRGMERAYARNVPCSASRSFLLFVCSERKEDSMHRLLRIIMALAFIAAMILAVGVQAAPAQAGTAQNYLVLYKGNAVATDAITRAGGTLVANYNAIGVAVVRSSSATFAADVRKDNRVEGAAATARFATRIDSDVDAGAEPLPGNVPATDNDSLSGLQWDMVQIHAPEAHAITGGSPSVVVGDIDTGVDYTHPDLAANMDNARSVNCVSGAPVQGMVAANDDNGHGTHTAGTIAAASNGIGIVGVAPNVKIAAIKAGNAAGFFFPEAVICSFMWAGDHQIQVTNNSYFADPWLFNCKNDPEQRAIWKAERRAIKYAMSKGTVVVAAEGNQSDDLAHPTQDSTSPDDTTPVTREITNACAVVPVEVSGVIGVTANGNKLFKSYYSSYGVGTADVIAPGGDRRFQLTPAAANGRVLSTWPASQPCAIPVMDSGATYCYAQGTSMASPHVAGVAALIVSQGIHSPGAVAAKIQNTADPIACPTDMSVYANFPAFDNGAPQVCTGGTGYNSFNGHGQVNALSAITR
jgi:lantibiotic leader peptide-processing serine protease